MFAASNSRSAGGYGRISAKFTTVANFADVKLAAKFVKAVEEVDVKTMRKIIKKDGFDANTFFRFENGTEKMTALHYAAKKGILPVVHELLSVGCDVNIVTPFDMATPLFFVCQHGPKDTTAPIVRELVTSGADVNCGDHTHRTPLVIVSESGHLDIVKLLLDYGASMDVPCKDEDYPDGIRQALKFISTMSEREIDEMCDPFRANNAMHQACREHHYWVVKELLYRGCDLSATNAAGNAPLHIACKSESRSTYSDHLTRNPIAGNIQIVKALLESGANLNSRNKHGDTPLKRAIDGISEIALWNIAIDDKIEESKNFCDIIITMICAGSRIDLMYPDEESTLVHMMRAAHTAKIYDCRSLMQKINLCIQYMVAAGFYVTKRDLRDAEKLLKVETMGLMEQMMEKSQLPGTLKRICKVEIRKICATPLTRTLPQLGLPTTLQKYVALEIPD